MGHPQFPQVRKVNVPTLAAKNAARMGHPHIFWNVRCPGFRGSAAGGSDDLGGGFGGGGEAHYK